MISLLFPLFSFIFAVLIQLFISNQRSILEIINSDINDYKREFGNTNIELLSDKFKCVSSSLDKQNKRLDDKCQQK